MSEPTEVTPGVLHWTARHPNLGMDVSSYHLLEERILLTNRHHLRDCLKLRERFGVTIRAPRTGMDDLPAEHVTPYDFGEELTGGIRPHGISEDWPDESALEGASAGWPRASSSTTSCPPAASP